MDANRILLNSAHDPRRPNRSPSHRPPRRHPRRRLRRLRGQIPRPAHRSRTPARHHDRLVRHRGEQGAHVVPAVGRGGGCGEQLQARQGDYLAAGSDAVESAG